MFGELINAVKARIGSTVRFTMWSAIAGVLALVAIGFLIDALHAWLAQTYGAVQASLAIGGGLLLVAAIIVAIAALLRRRAAYHLKLQQQRLQGRLSVQPAALATTLMAQHLGAKQTTALMIAALAAGFLMGRPRHGSSRRD